MMHHISAVIVPTALQDLHGIFWHTYICTTMGTQQCNYVSTWLLV